MDTNDSLKSAIVVADDKELVRKEISSILRKLGFQILAAPSGTAALNLHRDGKRPVDLLVVDTATEGLEPSEIAHNLQEISARVLFLSDGDAEQAPGKVGGHVFRVLSKPFRRAKLLGEVLNLMDQPLALGA